jgi:hypothetical protein
MVRFSRKPIATGLTPVTVEGRTWLEETFTMGPVTASVAGVRVPIVLARVLMAVRAGWWACRAQWRDSRGLR